MWSSFLCCVITPTALFTTGCCLDTGECDPNAIGPSIGNVSLYVPSALQPATATVQGIEGPKVILRVTGNDYPLWLGPGAAALSVGQQLQLQFCNTGISPNADRYVVLRDDLGRLVLASSGLGWLALDATCAPKELTVTRHDSECCSRRTDCGDQTPFSLRITGETSVTVYSGQTGTIRIGNDSFAVVNSQSVDYGESGECIDHVQHKASYVVYRVKQS